MRVAADVLSTGPAMQIRYLEAMQAMAKSSGSKIIFMPGPVNSGDYGLATASGEAGSSSQQVDPVQHAINARVLENM
jgi:erythrocyte band 7 integral membrane protein